MKTHTILVIIVVLLLKTNVLLGQVGCRTYEDLLRNQINELAEQRNFIRESPCPINKEDLQEYEANYELLRQILDIATLVYDTPVTITKDRIIEQEDKFVKYQSTNLSDNNSIVIVKRDSPRISAEGLISDNSTIPVGTKLLTETFTFNKNEFEVHYGVRKNFTYLISLEAIFPNKTRVYIDIETTHADFRVYNTDENGSEDKKIQVFFDPDYIGKINWLKTPSYELYLDTYLEDIPGFSSQKIRKRRYAIRCYDDNGKQITPTRAGNDIEIKPTTHLLWYKGFIGKHPIKMMLKRGFKENYEYEQNLEVMYGYDNKKEWIDLVDLTESDSGIFGSEIRDKYYPHWYLECQISDAGVKDLEILKGEWLSSEDNELPITLTLLSNFHPDITFKAKIEEEITPSGEVSNKIVKGITVLRNQKEIQYIKFDHGPSIDDIKVGYVDINYDGYLDLIIEDNFYYYNATTKHFDSHEFKDEYFPYLTELSQYNLFTKSFTAQMNRTMLEYRAVNGKMTPYHSSSYFPNVDGDMVMLEEKYVNGKWKTVEERIEKMDDEEEPKEIGINIASPDNYALNIDLTPSDSLLYFSPFFYIKTDSNSEFDPKEDVFEKLSKLFVEVTGADGVVHQQFLYDVILSTEKEQMLEDNAILFDGNSYVLNSSDGPIPFFPPNLKNGAYTFRLKLEQPLFGEIYSKAQQINLPLAIKKSSKYIHLKGSIGTSVKGDLYFVIGETSGNNGTFVNAKTGQRIKLTGELKGKSLNLKEYKKEDELSGYFEGKLIDDVYKGNWLSPDRKTSVPFEFKQQ